MRDPICKKFAKCPLLDALPHRMDDWNAYVHEVMTTCEKCKEGPDGYEPNPAYAGMFREKEVK